MNRPSAALHKKLGELFVFKNGRAFKKEEWCSKGLPIIRIQNLNNEEGSFNYYAGEYSDAILVQNGDLLFSWSGTVGSSFGPHIWQRGKGLLNQHIFAVSFKTEMNKQYAYYALEKITEEIEQQVNGAVGLVHITKEKLNDFTIPVPLLSEQQRVAAILDKAFDGIATAKATAEKNVQNARALYQTHLNAILTQRDQGWVSRRLGDLSMMNYGYTESACVDPVGPKFLRITDIHDNHIDWNSVPYCSIATSEIPKYQLIEGDIVFARTGATTGKSSLITDPPNAVFASYLIRVRLYTQEILPPFLMLFFQTKSYWNNIKLGSSGSAQGGFNATKLAELVIPYPKLIKAQQTIIIKLNEFSTEIQRLESIYTKKLSALEELKKSLLHQAFLGNL